MHGLTMALDLPRLLQEADARVAAEAREARRALVATMAATILRGGIDDVPRSVNLARAILAQIDKTDAAL